MGKEFLQLPTMDFLREITKLSLSKYRNSHELQQNSFVSELEFDSNYLYALLKKFQDSKSDVAGNKVLLGYIDYYCERINKLLSNEKKYISAYEAYPQYGEQYFSLIYDVLNTK